MAGVVVDSGQETVDGFLPRLIIAKCRLIEAGEGVVGADGSNRNFSFYSIGGPPILLSFQD